MSVSPSSQNRPVVQLQNVSKVFEGGTHALEGVSLSIVQGSFTSLLGPSGCGKSTLLKIIAGLIAPSAGTLDTSFSGPGSIGYVFQDPTLMPWADVKSNVMMPLDIMGLEDAEKEARTDEALALVELTDFADHYPRALSGGMKMRASLARALVSKPGVLLLDEPFAALDEMTRNRLNDDLIRIAAEQDLTIVFVTHSIFESVYLSDRIVVLAARPGRPIAEFRPAAPEGRQQGYRLTPDYTKMCGEVSAAVQTTLEGSL